MDGRLLLVLLVTVNIVASLNIQTNCELSDYHAVGKKYRCSITNNLIIDTPEQASIETLKNSHISGKTDDDEVFFHIASKQIQFIPRGMEKFYKNLIGIVIWHTQLKEIHQEDLKSYPKLSYFNLSGNKIEIIEDGLFDYNPDMEVIVFENMKIFHIGLTVFENLSKLTTLYLGGNPCTNEASMKDRTATLNVISSAKTSCSSSEFINLKRKLENLAKISNNLNFANAQIFSQKLLDLQDEFTASKAANFSPLRQKLENLLDVPIKSHYEDVMNNFSGVLGSFVTATNLYSAMDDKLTNLKIKFSETDQKLSDLKHKIEQDLEDSQQNILKSVDSKIEDLETRLTRKIEDILDEKLEKVMTNIRKIVTSV